MNGVTVALLGFGNIGRAFADYVGRMSDGRIRLHIRAVADSSGGLFIENDELLQRIIDHKAAGQPLRDFAPSSIVTDPHAFIDRLSASGVRVLVESLPTNLQDGQPALNLIKAALSAGIHVVTVDTG